MKKEKLRGKDLAAIGYTDTDVRSLALHLVTKGYKHESKETKIALLKQVVDNPAEFTSHSILGPIAFKLIDN